MLSSVVSLVAFGVALQGQAALRPVRLEPPSGGGNAVTISATGIEQDPTPVPARWNGDDKCLGDIACFVSSWIEANAADTVEHLVALRASDERGALQRRFADPQLLSRNAMRFKQIRSWSLLGWIDYGAYRIVMLTKDDPLPSTSPVYTLALKKEGTRWAQTDALATDTNIYQVLDRVAKEVLERHRK
jgi:hypothetical protein